MQFKTFADQVPANFSTVMTEAFRITRELYQGKVPSKDAISKILYLLRHDVHEV